MSVIVGSETRLCVSGITGSEGTFHTLNNKRYGTNVVSGVTPGKGGRTSTASPSSTRSTRPSRRAARTRR